MKDEKIVKNQHGGLKLPLFDLKPRECNGRCQNLIALVPTNQFIVPSTLLAPATEIRTHKAIKPQRYIRSNY